MIIDIGSPSSDFLASKTKRKFWLTPREIIPHAMTIIKSAIIGVTVGIAPAAGPTIAAIISYNEAKRASKNPEEFGQGHPDGVLAAETANNGATGGSLVLALSIGIPGSAAAAILLGALIMKGIQPGPMVMRSNADTVFTFMVGFAIVNVIVFFMGHFFVQIGYYILKIPNYILAPLILVICFLGAFAVDNSMFNVYVMLVVGLIAYFLAKLDFPMPPLILALILGPLMETNYGISLRIAFGDYFIFFKRPLATIFLIIAIVTFLWPLLVSSKKRQAR
jgi:putative tricarboxylic transport membrane protein